MPVAGHVSYAEHAGGCISTSLKENGLSLPLPSTLAVTSTHLRLGLLGSGVSLIVM